MADPLSKSWFAGILASEAWQTKFGRSVLASSVVGVALGFLSWVGHMERESWKLERTVEDQAKEIEGYKRNQRILGRRIGQLEQQVEKLRIRMQTMEWFRRRGDQ